MISPTGETEQTTNKFQREGDIDSASFHDDRQDTARHNTKHMAYTHRVATRYNNTTIIYAINSIAVYRG